MNKDEIDIMWQQAMQESIKDGEMFTRYHFAEMVAEAEREACAKLCDNKAIRYAERGALPEKLRDIDPKNAVVASQVCGHIAYEIRARGQA
jgi:hypothetical protein